MLSQDHSSSEIQIQLQLGNITLTASLALVLPGKEVPASNLLEPTKMFHNVTLKKYTFKFMKFLETHYPQTVLAQWRQSH